MSAIFKTVLACLVGLFTSAVYANAKTEATLRVQSFNATGTRNLDSQRGGFLTAIQLAADTTYEAWRVHVDLTGAAQNGATDLLDWQSREAFIGYAWEDGLVRVGRQVVTSGRADGFNPTDILSPWNRTRMTLDESWQRDGRLAVLIKQNLADYSIQAMAFHDNRYDVLPKPPLVGLNFSQDMKWRDAYAMRLDYNGANIEGGLMLYTGADLQPSFDLSAVSLGRITETHTYTQLIGADAAAAFKGITWRSELACLRTASSSSNMWVRKPQCQAVLGMDHSWGNINFLVQVAQIHVKDWQPPTKTLDFLFSATVGQAQAQETIVSARVATSFYNEALQIELPCSFGERASDQACRPRLKWAVSDHLTAHLGADIYRGSPHGYFGRLKDNSLAILGLEFFAP